MQYMDLAAIYDGFMYDMPYEKWAEFILKKLGRCDTLLELGSGTGNMTARLSMRYDVTALDISEEMLDIAGTKLMKSGRSARLVSGDMRSVTLHKPCENAVCVCDGINYLLDEKSVKDAFLNVARNIVQGGKFIFDISSRQKLLKMNDQLYSEDRDEGAYIWRNSFDGDVITMDITFFVPKKNGLFRRFDEEHKQRAHEESEISRWLGECGFRVISITDDYSDEPVTENTQRITFVAEKI